MLKLTGFSLVIMLFSVTMAAGEGAIAGKVTWEGKPIRGGKIRMDADPNCAALHKKAPRNEEIVMTKDGKLRNVFIYVKDGLPEKKYEVPTEPVVLNQKGCVYKPHIWGVMAGQPITIMNSDDTAHNVHAMPKKNGEFNKPQPKKGLKMTRVFKKAEQHIPIKCDVHPWMGSYCFVMDHPFYAVSAKDGTYEIKGLPPGKYTVAAWQEKYGTQEGVVEVKDSSAAMLDFKFSKDSKATTRAK